MIVRKIVRVISPLLLIALVLGLCASVESTPVRGADRQEATAASTVSHDEIQLVAAKTRLRIVKLTHPREGWPYVKVKVRKSRLKANCTYYQRKAGSNKTWHTRIPRGKRFGTLTVKAPRGRTQWESQILCVGEDYMSRPFARFRTVRN